MSWWVSLADTVVAMPLVMLVGAVAVIVLLMVVGMRQRWEPEIPPTFGTGLQPPPPPRFYGVLAIVGISLVVMGGCLGALLHSPGLVFVGLAAYTATWIVRHILLFWEEEESVDASSGSCSAGVRRRWNRLVCCYQIYMVAPRGCGTIRGNLASRETHCAAARRTKRLGRAQRKPLAGRFGGEDSP